MGMHFQQAMQRQSQLTNVLSNMLKQRHNASMSIINNMR